MSDANPRDDYQGHDRDLEEQIAAGGGDKPASHAAEPEEHDTPAKTGGAAKK